MYNYILSSNADQTALPAIALKAVPTKRASLPGVTRYAGALKQAYPEQAGLISDIAKAASIAHDHTVTKNLYAQLLDLERYLVVTADS